MKTTTILKAASSAFQSYLFYDTWYDSRALKFQRQYHKFFEELLNRCKLLDFMLEMQKIKKELP